MFCYFAFVSNVLAGYNDGMCPQEGATCQNVETEGRRRN